MWNDRYKVSEYIYGIEPNEFVKDNMQYIGNKVLLPADGEGRNSIFLAKKGKDVSSFDGSSVAVKKALLLAEQNKVSINAIVSMADEFNFDQNHYDTIILCYFHMSPELRINIHQKCIKALKIGGTIILEGFSKEQLEYKSGGPKDFDMLFSKEIITDDFKDLEKIKLSKELVELNEGKYHQGPGSVIRFIGKKS